ncbi:MAG TPA: HlyD family secretion protein, partial [Rudaea sp.]|nr:HlyD family secretion protein [Rudaea sp.]
RARIEEGVNENAILVPQVGVTHDPKGQATALVVGPDNKVASRQLQLKGTSGDQWVVESGLDLGDRVIVSGVQKVQPGVEVHAVEAPANTTAQTAPSNPTATAPATSTQDSEAAVSDRAAD